MDVDGRVAIVTGSGAGTGRAIALRLAMEGAAVVVADIDLEGGRDTVRRNRGPGRTSRIRPGGRPGRRRSSELGDDLQNMVAVAERTYGGLDVLVNNAGDTLEPHFPDGTPEHWGAALNLNLRGPMLATQLALEAMGRRGGGAIVNVASVAGLGLAPHPSPEYGAAKAGLIRFTATLAPLRERMNVRVNCVVPHWIATERVREQVARMSPEDRAAVPVLLEPEEVADAVVELIRGDDLAGRVMVMWCEEPRRLLEADRRE